MEKAKRQTIGLDMAVGRVARTAMGLVGGALAIGSIAQYGREVLDTTVKMEGYTNVLRFASKDQREFVRNQGFVNSMIKDLKLPMMETYDGFAKMSSAMRNTPLEKYAKDIYRGISTASTVLHLDPYRKGLIDYAVTQMVSKGTVSSEELKRQLGESLPGAVSIAARSMKMSQSKFNKLLEDGKIQAADFLPKFAKALEDEFGKGLDDALNSMQAKITQGENRKLELKLKIGAEMQPAYLEFLELQNRGLEGAMKLVKWAGEHKGLIVSIGKAALTYVGIQIAITAYKKIHLVLYKSELTMGWLRLRQAIMMEGYLKAQAAGLGRIKSIYQAIKYAGMMPSPLGWITAGLTALSFFYSKWKDTQNQMAEDLKDPLNWGDFFKLNLADPMMAEIAKMGVNVTSPDGSKIDNTQQGMGGIAKMRGHDLFQNRLEKYREMLKEASSVDALEKLLGLGYSITNSNIESVLKAANEKYAVPKWDNGIMKPGDPLLTLDQFGLKKNKDGEVTKTDAFAGGTGSYGSSEVGAGRQVRNVNVTINGGLVGAITISTTNLADATDDIVRKIKDALVRSVRDSELALGN